VLAESTPGAGDRFRFMGREFDGLTGLYYFRGRYYDPRTGRFVSQDSWGFASGDANLYRFVGNAPLTHRDPLGHVAVVEETWVRRLAGLVAGSIVGYLCGYLEGLAESANVPDPAVRQAKVQERALEGAAWGAAVGLGLALLAERLPMELVLPVTLQVGATLSFVGGFWIGQSPTAGHVVARVGCTIAAFMVPEILEGVLPRNCFVAGTEVLMAACLAQADVSRIGTTEEESRTRGAALAAVLAGVVAWQLLREKKRRRQGEEAAEARELGLDAEPEGEAEPVESAAWGMSQARPAAFGKGAGAWKVSSSGMSGLPSSGAAPLGALGGDENAMRTSGKKVPVGQPGSGWRNRLAVCCLLTGLLVAALVWGGPGSPTIAEGPSGLAAEGLSRDRSQPIESIRVGQRVRAHNPELADTDRRASEPDVANWRCLQLQVMSAEGIRFDIELLRPLAWLEAVGARVGGEIELDLPEMGLHDAAKVLAIRPCPESEGGPGFVVTGTFVHEAEGNLLNVFVEGLDRPIGCTQSHPFWSEDQQAFVFAADLHVGDRLRTGNGGVRRVYGISSREGREFVYNLEVDTEHVFYVSQLGVLVHNNSPQGSQKGNAPTKNANPSPTYSYGRLAHVFSRPVTRVLADHPTLGEHSLSLREGITASAVGKLHYYDASHRALDAEIIQWLQHPDNQTATVEELLAWLRWRYDQPDLKADFPEGIRDRRK
jgi:RHS repeat-associated protein